MHTVTTELVMNAQLLPRPAGGSPLRTATDRARSVTAERTRTRPIETCLAPSSGLDAAYGCVDWFMYQKAGQPQ